MNGRFTSAIPAADLCLPRQKPWSDDIDATLLRLLAAFVLSCLLHAAVVILPYLGKFSRETRFPPPGGRESPLVLDATLASAGERRYPDAARNASAGAEPVPNALAAQRPAVSPQPGARPRAEGADLLPFPAREYYTTDQLTKRPQPLTVADLDAPEIRPIVASGKLVLKLWINEFGVVADVTVEKTELPEAFSRTAAAAFRSLRFTPGERDGQPVGTVMRIEVSYDDGRPKPD